jgi:hypothetical protein
MTPETASDMFIVQLLLHSREANMLLVVLTIVLNSRLIALIYIIYISLRYKKRFFKKWLFQLLKSWTSWRCFKRSLKRLQLICLNNSPLNIYWWMHTMYTLFNSIRSKEIECVKMEQNDTASNDNLLNLLKLAIKSIFGGCPYNLPKPVIRVTWRI